MIDRNHDLTITRQAELLGMSRGSMYYLPRPTSAADLALMRRIDELHLDYPFMGAPICATNCTAPLCTLADAKSPRSCAAWASQALAPQPGTSKRAPGHKIYPYLLRKLAVLRPNQVWARRGQRCTFGNPPAGHL